MATSTSLEVPPSPAPRRLPPHRTILVALALLLAVPLVISLYLITHWPYGYPKVQPSLNKAFHGEVHIESFHAVFFPHPGFIAAGLTLRRGLTPAAAAVNPAPPLATAAQVIVEGRWLDLLTLQHRVRLVQIESLHLTIPPANTAARVQDFPPGDGKDFSGPATFIEDLHLQNALLEIQEQSQEENQEQNRDRKPGHDTADKPTTPSLSRKPFLLLAHDIHLLNVVKDHAATFSVITEIPRPNALIHGSGTLGPLHSSHLQDTPVDATYTFSHGRLEDFTGLHGFIDAAGHLHGTLAAIDIDANATTTDFAVNRGQPVKVANQVHATVNGLNGDTILHTIDAETGATVIHASGSVIGKPKHTLLDITVIRGHIQDVMRPFLHADPPVTGDLHLHTVATLAPNLPPKPFLKRLAMDGDLDVPDQRFTKPSTEQGLSAFSRRAQGLDPSSPDAKSQPPRPAAPGSSASGAQADPDIMLSLRGPVHLRNGIASTPRLDVVFPGASMLLAGTFDLHSQTAHLTGNLSMQSDISHVTTGWKSKLLKPLSPFFKHHKTANPASPTFTEVPIAITGTGKFKISSNILGKR